MSSEQQAHIRAVGYASVKSPAPIHDPDFMRQERIVERFCAQRDWNLIACLRDVEPRRSRTWRRPALYGAIERIASGEATCLVAAELRRLCPSIADLGWILQTVDEASGRIVSLDPPLDTGTPVGRAVARALASVSDWERSRRAELTSAARSKAPVSGTISPDLRRRIQRLRGAGLTLQAIADLLNEEGVPTVRGGARWRPSSVQSAVGYRRPQSLSLKVAPTRSKSGIAGQLV
jgi:DNA invertase Pin-like site-specific DNA recombinase